MFVNKQLHQQQTKLIKIKLGENRMKNEKEEKRKFSVKIERKIKHTKKTEARSEKRFLVYSGGQYF